MQRASAFVVALFSAVVELTALAGEVVAERPDGLKIEELVVGEGAEAISRNIISVHYTGWLDDGTQFDSSHDRGQPLKFPLGVGRVIRGWDEGVVGMREGGKRRLTIPPELAYGDRGAGKVVPPGATLLFEVELIKVE